MREQKHWAEETARAVAEKTGKPLPEVRAALYEKASEMSEVFHGMQSERERLADLTKLSSADHEQIISDLSKFPLSELRKRQDIIREQQAAAYAARDDKALDNLQIKERHHAAAVDRREFGAERAFQEGPRGGRYYVTAQGQKVYIKPNPGPEIVGQVSKHPFIGGLPATAHMQEPRRS